MTRYVPHKRALSATLLLLSVVLLIITARLYSEDLLRKTGQKYLGWQTAQGKFTTCAKKVLDIGDGKVEQTDKKCDETPGPGPITGLIKSVDTEKWTVVLGTDDGKSLTCFYPELSQPAEQNRLKSLMSTHNRVKALSPVAGRVDSITVP